ARDRLRSKPLRPRADNPMNSTNAGIRCFVPWRGLRKAGEVNQLRPDQFRNDSIRRKLIHRRQRRQLGFLKGAQASVFSVSFSSIQWLRGPERRMSTSGDLVARVWPLIGG